MSQIADRLDAIYARQSIDKADSISVESQIEFCRYETHGAPCRVYQDKGYSGKNTDRPEFQQMLSAIRRGEIKRVICYKLDRCSRSILDFATLMEEFQKYHVEFISCTEKFDTSSPMGRAMLNICIVFAQLERETIQQRVLDAYHSRSRHGFFMGGKAPFGFRLEPWTLDGKKTSRYTAVEQEVAILEFMYSVYEQPMASLGDVVSALAEAGMRHPRRQDGRWTRTYIGRMLCNPIYVKADLNIYRFFRENGVIIHNNPSDFIGTNGCYLYSEQENLQTKHGLEGCHLVLAPHAGLIPSDIWLRCRKKQKLTGETVRRQRSRNTWLSGKIKCAGCGYALIAKKTVRKNGKVYRYIVCPEGSCKGVHGLKADEVEKAVLKELYKKIALFPALPVPGNMTSSPENTALTVQIAQLDREIEDAASKVLEASGPLVQYLSRRVAELEQKRNVYAAKLKELENAATDRRCIVTKLTDYLRNWDRMTLEDKTAVVDALIDRIILSQSQMTVFWKV